METWDFLREMDEAGYKAVCIKEHFIPTTGLDYIINKAPCAPKTRVIGGLAFNNALGGLNLMALDAAVALGARQIFMPTVSAQNHLEYLKTVTKFNGGSLTVPEKPICVIDETGELIPEVLPIIDYMAAHPDLLLSMGHLSPAEIDVLLPYALNKGVKKIVVDHPYFIMGAAVQDVKNWAGMGAYINFTASSLEGLGGDGHVPMGVLEQTLDAVPEDKMVISTDFGQPYNGSPVEGMYKMICTLINDLHVPEQWVMDMTHSIPSMLLGI